jgi:flagellar motor switch protein FliN/FliY
MAGESDIIGQAEIEALLQQAQNASQPAGSGPPGEQFSTAARESSRASTATREPERDSGHKTASSASDDIQFLLDQAEAAIASVNQPNPSPAGLMPYPLTDLVGAPASQERATLDLLRDVELDLKIELGRTNMYLEDVLKLKRGSVVTLDKLAGDPVDVYVNGRLIARGEVLVLNDNFCVRVAELVSGDDLK